jgi:hypothetical protein
LYYPSLDLEPESSDKAKIFGKVRILKREQVPGQDFFQHLQAICFWLKQDFDLELELYRWGKVNLPDQRTLASRVSETKGTVPARSSRYFEVIMILLA